MNGLGQARLEIRGVVVKRWRLSWVKRLVQKRIGRLRPWLVPQTTA